MGSIALVPGHCLSFYVRRIKQPAVENWLFQGPCSINDTKWKIGI